jgi:small subunit ribosomal protein S6
MSPRVEVQITVVGEPSDFRKTARAAEALLQRLSGDQTLTIKYIRKGSIKIRITCSPEASQKLARLHEGGQFDELLGFRVTGLREFAPPSAPSTGVHDLPVRIYEELFIVKPDASDESIDGLVLQLTETIAAHDGHLDKVQKWGVRKLAYRVAGVSEGYYVLVQFSGVASIVKELERRLRISDLVLKFITVRIDQKLKKIEKRKKEREERAARSIKAEQPSSVHDDFESEERVGTGAISEKIQELLKQSFGPD